MIRLALEIETGRVVTIYEDGTTKTFDRPTTTAEALDVAEAISAEPEAQREVALELIRTLSLLPQPAAPYPLS